MAWVLQGERLGSYLVRHEGQIPATVLGWGSQAGTR